MSVKQLVIGTFNQTFKKYFYDELVVGKLAHTEFKSAANKGDEVDILMPGSATLFNYSGDNLPEAEIVTNSTTKIRLDRAKAFHFELSKFEEKAIENSPSLKQKVSLVKEYSSDATKQFAASVDQAYADLYTRAGIAEDASSDIMTADLAKDILAYMRTKFQRGDNKGHNNWVDGSMICIVPPEFEMYLGKSEELKYVESGHKKIEKGFIGRLEGWDILVSNNIANPEDGIFYPLFGIRGKTLAGGVGDNLNTTSYVPEKNFNTRYKGFGIYGVGAPRADFFGTVKVKTPLSLTSLTSK